MDYHKCKWGKRVRLELAKIPIKRDEWPDDSPGAQRPALRSDFSPGERFEVELHFDVATEEERQHMEDLGIPFAGSVVKSSICAAMPLSEGTTTTTGKAEGETRRGMH